MNIISEDISVAARFNKLYRLMSQSVGCAAWPVVPCPVLSLRLRLQTRAGNNRNSRLESLDDN